MDDDVRAKVKNIYISLNAVDLDDGDRGTNAEYQAWVCHEQGAVDDVLYSMDYVDYDINRMKTNLDNIWYRKMYRLTDMKLQNLVIDCRNVYGVDGSFLAVPFMRLVPQFSRKRSKNVRVIADEDEVATQLLELFNVRNPERH